MRFTLAILFLGFAFQAPADDNESTRGRLPDGRAFRTDTQGNQLVDYIAELELTVEGLNQQLQAAQNELDEKNFSLGKCQGGNTSELVERTLKDEKSEEKDRACEEKLSKVNLELQMVKDDRDLSISKLRRQEEVCRTASPEITVSKSTEESPAEERIERGSIDVGRLRVAQSLQGSLTKEIQRVQKLSDKRQRLATAALAKALIQPDAVTDPTSSRGRTLTQISESVKTISDPSDVSVAMGEVNQIRHKLDADSRAWEELLKFQK